ncbi:predicted protein [Arabidopsis lyrata subsp. lyrata]|uniref:Predicted protein n=1 Tax=Arabidopsis lyrata subsp. lyrata TaxID=81972 RepID=D7KXF6_ARALL|nr:predicted protein [Arabidopsis lyrata subsp. lyrata]
MALLLTLQHAKDLGFTKIFIASDSRQLIKELHRILYNILLLSSLFDDVKFSSISRCNNRVGDALAKLGLSGVTVLAKQNYCVGNH